MKNNLPKLALFSCALVTTLVTSTAQAADGLITMKSPHSAKETMNRFEAAAQEKGNKVIARVDHSATAKTVGKTLRPTEVLVFGNAQGGTALMECAQSMGMDLPQKAFAWEDDKGQVWLAVNDMAYLAKRHSVSAPCPAVEGVGKALAGLAAAAVAP
jgi:uncharacterized protein (DUF302 family)